MTFFDFEAFRISSQRAGEGTLLRVAQPRLPSLPPHRLHGFLADCTPTVVSFFVPHPLSGTSASAHAASPWAFFICSSFYSLLFILQVADLKCFTCQWHALGSPC